MNAKSLQAQALKLPLPERWQLVQSLLTSIQQETQNFADNQTSTDVTNFWISKLVGVIQPPETDSKEQYINYLEEKYQ
ncbi:hypothetical protein [Pseudanabaena mucicola]|uniref:Uncharacterized protein n=1 Tax=Pseudanabaena mucicola FACHB-723 TaxID=2692860 RepID=A0ABR7ZWK2_9CYAN|nr:hypothetical protein [Pseudanabaena mucicola]MBD2188328.1 hypothetical protein [Pseudanabaena mucicola FACHB-723]